MHVHVYISLYCLSFCTYYSNCLLFLVNAAVGVYFNTETLVEWEGGGGCVIVLRDAILFLNGDALLNS